MGILLLRSSVAEVGSPAVTGLEWPGNESGNTSRILVFDSPLAYHDATYIWRSFPKGPKTGPNPRYWTEFFWANFGDFDSSDNYYGAHPYPFDGNSQDTGQNHEISIVAADYSPEDADGNHDTPSGGGNGGAEMEWDRWYTRVFRAFRHDADTTRHQFFYDWDLFVSSNGTAGWFQHTVDDASWGTVGNNPPSPSIVIGEAPPNGANSASWGGYVGREQFKGILRGFQFYDARLGTTAHVPSVANLAEVASELATPGSVRTPWYLKLNPTPDDVADDSISGNDPAFPASLPSLWTE